MLKDIDKKVDLRTLCKRLAIDFKKPFSNIIDSFNNILGASPLDLTTQYAGMFKKSEKAAVKDISIIQKRMRFVLPFVSRRDMVATISMIKIGSDAIWYSTI